MNRINFAGQLRVWALPFAAALTLAASPAFAQVTIASGAHAGGSASAQSSSKSGKLAVVSSEPLQGTSDNVASEAIEVRIEDGKVSVKRNGKDVPEDHIRREDDGRIIILDDDGKELKHLNIVMDALNSGNFFRTGNGDTVYGDMLTMVDNGDDEPAPKVMLGVHMGEPGEALQKHLGLEAGKTTMVTGVLEGLCAERAGLGEYDIITEVDGKTPADAASIKKALADKEPGDTIAFRIIQSGAKHEIKVKLEAYNVEKMHHAKLLGKEASTLWDGMPSKNGLTYQLSQIPNLKDRILLAPGDMKQWQGTLKQLQPKLEAIEPKLKELEPMIEKHMQEALRKYTEQNKSGGEAHNDKDVEGQLDRLDKRMADLEKMLQKVIERQQKP